MTEPFFQNDIFFTILRNLNFYFFGSVWYKYAIIVFILLFVVTYVIHKNNKIIISFPFNSCNDKFNRKNHSNLLALIICIGILAAYSCIIYLGVNSLFNNYDLMSMNTTFIFLNGLAASYGIARLCPISFFDVNIIYAVTHNFNIINSIIIAKQIGIAFLLYYYLSFMNITKRFLTISAILMVPAMFWINNIIFPEQNMLIFIITSLMFVKKYYQNQRFSDLFYFTLFANLAIYTKETVTIFYAGLLFFSILYNIYKENINLSNIWNPLRLARLFPIEAIIFCSLFIFALFYLFLVSATEENFYIFSRKSSISDILYLYRLEFFIITLGWIICLIKLIKKIPDPNPIYNEGLLFAGTSVLLYISFYLKIIPILEHVSHKSYYVVLTAVFGIIYIAQNIKSTKFLIILFTALTVYSSVINYQNYHKENGIYYQEVAGFFSKKMQNEKQLSIFISKNSEQSDWAYETWGSSYKYYFPAADITFKFVHLAENSSINKLSIQIYSKQSEVMTKIKGAETPEQNDYYIIKKGKADSDYEIIKNIPHDLVFENKRFRIYKIK